MYPKLEVKKLEVKEIQYKTITTVRPIQYSNCILEKTGILLRKYDKVYKSMTKGCVLQKYYNMERQKRG